MSKKNKPENAEKVLEEGEDPGVATVTVMPDPEVSDVVEKPVDIAAPADQYYRGHLITSDIVDEKHHHGHIYKKFSVATGESFMISPEEFDAGTTTE